MRGRKVTLLPGMKRGVLTILERLPRYRLRVRCECGREKEISEGSFRGTTIHCTCDLPRCGHPKYLPGLRFGKLVIRKRLPGGKTAVCRCDCGNETIVRLHNLVAKGKSGRRNTSSCGCTQYSGRPPAIEVMAQQLGDFLIVGYRSGVMSGHHAGQCIRCGWRSWRCPARWRKKSSCPRCNERLKGRRFDAWEVLCHEREHLGWKQGRAGYWWCRCMLCGVEKSIWGSNLMRGVSSSCRKCSGLLRRERNRQKALETRAATVEPGDGIDGQAKLPVEGTRSHSPGVQPARQGLLVAKGFA